MLLKVPLVSVFRVEAPHQKIHPLPEDEVIIALFYVLDIQQGRPLGFGNGMLDSLQLRYLWMRNRRTETELSWG